MRRENFKLRHCKKESIDARHRGGNFRISDEVLVMRMERREVVIQFLIINENCSASYRRYEDEWNKTVQY
jgi:hypothetical protein